MESFETGFSRNRTERTSYFLVHMTPRMLNQAPDWLPAQPLLGLNRPITTQFSMELHGQACRHKLQMTGRAGLWLQSGFIFDVYSYFWQYFSVRNFPWGLCLVSIEAHCKTICEACKVFFHEGLFSLAFDVKKSIFRIEKWAWKLLWATSKKKCTQFNFILDKEFYFC